MTTTDDLQKDKEMSEKIFKIVNGDISDGYHTFDELYKHRCLLWICYVLSDGCPGKAYWVKEHFKGWDLIVVDTEHGQISYHVPMEKRFMYETLEQRESNTEYDGHTSNDVIERLTLIASMK